MDFVALILAKMEPKKDRNKKERRPVSFRKEYSIEFPCITSSRKGTQHAFCRICRSDFSVAAGGKNDINRHLEKQKHKNNEELERSSKNKKIKEKF